MGFLAGASSYKRKRPLRISQVILHSVVLSLLALSLIPIYLMVSMSFKNALQYRWQRWTLSFPLRYQNYVSAWDVIGHYVINTVVVAIVSVLGVLILSLIGGYVFARMRFPLREKLFLAILALLMVPWIVSFIPAYMIYVRLGLINSLWGLIIPNISGGQVFGIFLMRAFIAGIPEELYESARCDGAGVWSLITKITLPLALPALATLAVLNFVGIWNNFLWPLVMIQDMKKQVISVGLYRLSGDAIYGGFYGWSSSDLGVYGPLNAGYVIASLPLVLLFVGLGKFYVEGMVESGLKA